MKNYKIPIILVLVFLTVYGWFQIVDTQNKNIESYNTYLELAKEKAESGLYQEAIEQYENALAYKSTEAVWKEYYNTYSAYYEKKNTSAVKRESR